MEKGTNPSLFHFDLLGGGCILMCLHVGLAGLLNGLLPTEWVLSQTPSTRTRRMACGVYKAKDSGAYISFGGGVKFILHITEWMCMNCAHAPDGAWCRWVSECDCDCTHGMSMHVCSALDHTCKFAHVRWRAVLDVIIHVGDTSQDVRFVVRCMLSRRHNLSTIIIV